MVQIVKNCSRIVGVVETWTQPAHAGEPGLLTVRVERVHEVQGPDAPYANLLTGSEGQRLLVQIPAATAATAAYSRGQKVDLEVRRGRAPNKAFAR